MDMYVVINIIFTLLSLIYWGVTFTILYHLTRFGVGTAPKRLAALFLLGAVILYSGALLSYHSIDLSYFI